MTAAAVSFGVMARSGNSRTALGVVAAIAVSLFVLSLVAGHLLVARWAVAAAEQDAEQTAQTHAGLLASELQKYRLLPFVLADDREVRAALRGEGGAVARLNPKLELLASRTDTAVIYVLDSTGRAIAASNWRLPTSFLGHSYDFRSYFTDAMRSGQAEQFALGAVSHRPGLFLAQRIVDRGAGGAVLGVVVIKVQFDRLERAWRHQPGATLVTDAQGVVILTSQPDWRFKTLHPITGDALTRLRHSVQFGNSPLTPLPLQGEGSAKVIETDGNRYVTAQAAAPIAGWSLQHLEPLQPFDDVVAARLREVLFASALVGLVILGLGFRHHEREKMRRETQHVLEKEVSLRTAELRSANDQLRIETTEHARAEAQLRAAGEELAQANRLGVLGQVTAGVAHEVNQPVAAIRTFAENAIRQVEREDRRQALASLGTIVELTTRIGQITQELRGFARPSAAAIEPVALRAAVDGALLLLRDRIRATGARVDLVGLEDTTLYVVGDRVRLEQVLINVLQNALDAIAEVPHRRIIISTQVRSDAVSMVIADNGAGIDPAVADTLFDPLVTGRPEGLGLGLAIARRIARDFGGELDLAPPLLAGASFVLRLRRADV